MTCWRLGLLAFLPLVFPAYAAPAAADGISGTLALTKVIVEDSQLVGDVICTMTTIPASSSARRTSRCA